MQYAADQTYQKIHMDGSKPWLLGYPLSVSAAFDLEVHKTNLSSDSGGSHFGYLAGQAGAMMDLQEGWSAGATLNATQTTLDSTLPGADSSSSTTTTWSYYGADFILRYGTGPLRDGSVSSELLLNIGGGIADRERVYTRSHAEITAGAQLPIWLHQAFHVRLVTKYLNTDEPELVSAEMYRVGGYGSVRGYLENEFAFRTVAYDQLEYLYYFGPTASAYIFLDDGFGFTQSLSVSPWSDRTDFLGYGVGVRLPAKYGVLTLEWGRNKNDGTSLGRINVGLSNQ